MENPNKDNFSQGKKESKCINKQIRLSYVITGVFVPVIPLLTSCFNKGCIISTKHHYIEHKQLYYIV